MKLFKLWLHQKSFSEDDLVINPKNFPLVKIGDVLEICCPEDEYSRLLLQVKSLREDLQKLDTVSISNTIVSNVHFQMRMYQDVYVQVVNQKDVALDMVELNYKEKYFSRGDMWRLGKSLVSTALYLNKKVKFAEMGAQVEELWARGEKVTCGVVTDDTRVTFRSSTAQVSIFIQMSSEMWEFDNYGDLFFEKVVDGFLVDLFTMWKEKNCNHDVTITLYSRTFYDAQSFDEFPAHMRACLQQDYLGRFYEDFYRVVVQNERYDDWTGTIIQLKKLFNEYPQRVLHYHHRPGLNVPRSWNSNAAQGNVIEVLNMALNVFEKYFLDRCFDRTGKLSILITPGSGVFEVDRELTNITKQRTIDCGNPSDLVCMGEQPLHAVPLFKFHNKNPSHVMDVGDDYNIPHWINHSFYTSKSQAERMAGRKFVPRIQMPPILPANFQPRQSGQKCKHAEKDQSSTALPTEEVPFVDYEEYDAQVFNLASYRPVVGGRSLSVKKSTSVGAVCYSSSRPHRVPRVSFNAHTKGLLTEDEATSTAAKSQPVAIPQRSRRSTHQSDQYLSNSFGGHGVRNGQIPGRPVIGSAGIPAGHNTRVRLQNARPHRALINPFAPSRLHFKVTSNRRRWAHAYPSDPQGARVQLHHQHSSFVQSYPEMQASDNASPSSRELFQGTTDGRRSRTQRVSESSTSDTAETATHRVKSVTVSSQESGSSESLLDPKATIRTVSSNGYMAHTDSTSSISSMTTAYEVGLASSSSVGRSRVSWGLYSAASSYYQDLSRCTTAATVAESDSHNWLWGVTGEQEWTPEIKTGMDWKALVKPASLPITTDYFPTKNSLEHDYMVGPYTLLPEDIASDCCQRWGSTGPKPLSTLQVYKEMIVLRLSQGFQIVVQPRPSSVPSMLSSLSSSPHSSRTHAAFSHKLEDTTEEISLSIGRIFHKLTLNGQSIIVTRYWPRYPHQEAKHLYNYRFQVPDSEHYGVSWTTFSNERLENYNWNHADNYLCTRGQEDHGLIELQPSLKYWRARFLLMPCNNPAVKKIMEGAERCDIYEEMTLQNQQKLVDGFVRLLEHMNKIRRPVQNQNRLEQNLGRRGSLTHSPGFTLGLDKEGKSKSSTPVGRMGELHVMDSPPVGSLSFASPGSIVPSMEHRKALFSETALSGPSLKVSEATPEKSSKESLSASSHLTEIVEAMLDLNDGLHFLNRGQQSQPQSMAANLPVNSFISTEGSTWVLNSVTGINSHAEACQLLQKMVDQQLICHASGDRRHAYIYGFYLFFIVQTEKDKKGEVAQQSWQPGYYHNIYFQHDWCEVEIKLNPVEPAAQVPAFLAREIPSSARECRKPEMKLVNVDADPNRKSERQEWGRACYQATISPSSAFELEVQWLVATGCILGELIMSWYRKAAQCGFHFLPVPGDPFALPFTQNSDPLRGPIFIPLNLDCLQNVTNNGLFAEFPESSWENRLHLFQDSILRRYGFMQDRHLPAENNFSNKTGHQDLYVHCSGGMFVLIHDYRSPLSGADNTTCSTALHQEYIAQQHGGPESPVHSTGGFGPVGFLWAWNFMLTKRWQASHTGYEHFQDKMLADFRALCGNQDNRLVDYWKNSLQKCKVLEQPSSHETSSQELEELIQADM